ncbi:ATP-binding protein [Lutispora saccharofermentans]|uniref:histidine kinase n=1 Tax=Lutispora saccharofermentans TaxID=3024236 RepID=A0ABT1NJJ0_9FIRM|nr:ATP-binding protein [Lutispora saccharofermentans]MCQ1531404.1 cell wall metabolism sensor histidine kinase WalK [Lutispora saccharofermentans]
MLKSIQWKLVIIYVLLVWLAMSIIGLYIVQAVEKDQISNVVSNIESKADDLSFSLKDMMAIGAYDVQDTVDNWFNGRGGQIQSVYVFNKNGRSLAHSGEELPMEDGWMISRALKGERVKDLNDSADLKNNYKSIAVPITSDGSEVIGAVYLNMGLTSINDSISNIKNILTSATIWALCFTVLLGSILARTITGPIKEVTSKAAKLATGDFEHIIPVRSDDEVGKLTEMFNYLTVRLKTTLNEMNNEKSKMETILTYMTDGVVAVSSEGTIIHANPAAFELFKLTKMDVEGKNFDDVANMLSLPFDVKSLFQDEAEKSNLISNGDSTIRYSIVPFKNQGAETAGAIIVLQDVTEQENLDRMRKEFVANVSHELRTPLTTIKSYTETLLDGALEDRDMTLRFLNVIDSESDRMTRLVKDLLMLSKLDYDKTQLNMKEIDLTKILGDCVYKMDISAKQKHQSISLEINDEIPQTIGDKDRIEQVMINIISNSIKYTQEKGKIYVSMWKEAEYIYIKVRDNGIGIPKKDMSRLFERFYRVDKARSRGLGGTGLGLSIAKQIVEAHNGQIQLDSVYGEGTWVTVILPIVSSVN